MTDDRIAAFIDRHGDAWNRRDAVALCLNHAEHGVLVSPMFTRVEGRSQICGTYAALFAAFPDWTLRYAPPIREGARLAVPFSVSATHMGAFMGLEGTGRRCEFEGVGFGLGGWVMLQPARAKTLGTPGDFGWGGMASTVYWVDPAEQMSVVFLTQLMPSSAWPIRKEIRALVYSALMD